jgi:Flp pilus assembly protein TadB
MYWAADQDIAGIRKKRGSRVHAAPSGEAQASAAILGCL